MREKNFFKGVRLLVLMAFICMLVLPKMFVNVNAEEDIKFTNFNEDGRLSLKLGEMKSFAIEGDEYLIRNCDSGSENTLDVRYNSENKTCEVTANAYGKFGLAVYYINASDADQEYPYTMYKNVTVEVDLDEYVTKVMDIIPNEFTDYTELHNQGLRDKLPENFNYYIDEGTCHQETNGRVCTLTVEYSYYDSTWQSVKKTKEIIFKGRQIPVIFASNIDVGKTSNISFYNINDINFDNYIFVSSDSTIASVSSIGKITGKTPGQVEIRMYDKITLEHTSATITVKQPTMDSQSFIEYFNQNRDIDIDISSAYLYMTGTPGQQEVDYCITARNYFYNYFYNVMPSDLGINIQDVTCDGTKCRIKYRLKNEEYETGELNFHASGIRVVSSSQEFIKGSDYNFKEDYYVQLLNEDSYSISVDPEYFSYNSETGRYKAIKLGTTEVTYLTNSGKMATMKVEIKYSQDDIDKVNQIFWNLNNIELPYKSSDFDGNLNLLSSVVKNKILDNIDDSNNFKNYMNLKVTCIFNGSCQVRANRQGTRNVNIKYDNLSTDTSILKIKEIDSKIKSSYRLSFEDTIDLDNKYPNEEDFYNHLIDKTDIMSLKEGSINITSNIVSINNMTNLLRGSVTYDVTVKLNDKNVFNKEVTIITDHILDSTGLDSHEEESRVEYIKNKIKSIVNRDVQISKVEDNYYRIDNIYNIMLDQKEELQITSINLTETVAEVNVGDTYKIKYRVYPDMANTGKIDFKSKNEHIAKVDENGVITALSNGITQIEMKIGLSSQTLTVLVGNTIESILNQIIDKLDSHVIVDYNALNYQRTEEAIKNAMWSDVYANSMGIDGLQINLTKENGKYYAELYKYLSFSNSKIIYSKKKPITYEFKGIRVKEGKVSLSKGDTYDTELFFSEGDFKNLIIENSNKEVARITENGVITALNPGTTYISIYDKYNQYYNNIQVYVDREDYVNQLIDSIKNSPIILHAKNDDSCVGCIQTEENKIENHFNRELYNQTELGSYYNLNTICNLSNNTCTVNFQEWNFQTGTTTTFRTETFNYEKRGVFFDKKETTVGLNESYSPTFTVYPAGTSVSMESMDTNVCVIENDKIKGVSKGICPVKFVSGDEINYHFAIVDEEGIINDIQNGLNNAPSNIDLKSPKYDPSVVTGEDYHEDAKYKSIYDTQIIKVLKDYIHLPSDVNYNIWYEIDLNEMAINDSVNVNLELNYYYENSNEEIYYSYNFQTSPSHKFEFTYNDIPEEITNMKNVIEESVKKQYNLSLMEVMQFQASNDSSMNVFKYSSLESDIKNVCADCTYEVDPSFGGGMGDEGFFQMTFPVVVFKDSYPITSVIADFIVKFNVTLESELKDENQMIELIKDEVREAYKTMKGIEPSARKSIRSSSPLRLAPMAEEEIEVDVTKEYNDDGSSYYNIKVEELEFKAVVGTNLSENVTVEYSQSPIKDFKLSTSVIHLTQESSKVINPVFEAEGEYDNSVVWTSSNESVATVDESGTVHAVGYGTATITARASNNMIAECEVNVSSFLKGDVTRDGRVDLVDVMLALRVSLDLVTADEDVITRGDINGVDGIDLADVMYILRIALNLVN